MSSIKHLNDQNFSVEISKGIVLVDFHAEWCGPCKMLAPVLVEVEKKVSGKAVIAKVDIDVAQKTAGDFGITSVPTMIIFKDGKEKKRLVGLRKADEIENTISSLI